MKKQIIICILLISLVLSGCNQSVKTDNKKEEHQMEIMIAAPKSPSTIPILRLIETNALGEDVKINLELYGDMEKMIVMATEEKYGFMVLPVHTAATLYNKGLGAKLLNVFGWGGMYLSTTDPECSTWEDLKDKTLYVPAMGSIPDIITQYFCIQHGLKIGENINVVYSSHHEIAQLIELGKIKYAVDAEPFVTRNSQSVEGYKIICDFAKEWKEINESQYNMPANGVITSNTFISNKGEWIERFNLEFEKALQWTTENPDDAAVLAEKYLNADAELIEKAMPNYKFLVKPAMDVKGDIEAYCEVLSSFKPESIGGKIPDEGFYYKNK